MKKQFSRQFEDLVENYFARIIRAISRKYYLVGGTEDDLFQEGMIGLFEAYQSYKGDDYSSDKFKNLAILCIRRQIYDAIKHANSKHNQPLNNYVPIVKTNSKHQEYDREDLFGLESENNPEELFLDKETHDEKIRLCKSKLSKFENKVLDLYLAGERQSQIAKILEKDVKSIDNTIQRIKNKVR